MSNPAETECVDQGKVEDTATILVESIATRDSTGMIVGKDVTNTPGEVTVTGSDKDEINNASERESENDDLDENEEALFSKLEQEEEGVMEQEVGRVRPQGIEQAPTLLREALRTGEVEASASEAEESKEPMETSQDIDPDLSPSRHQRQSQLDFLLDKATTYSEFIARDLSELQAKGEEEARAFLAKQAKKNKKKRKKSADDPKKSKKSKLDDSTENLVTGYDRPIFIQPPNLAPGCILKDYQLEGVRWLSTLYENGVSGILADEMGLGKTIQCVALIAHLLTKGCSGPFMVVAPLATLPNWVREFQTWLPTQNVVRYHGPDRFALFDGPLRAKQRLLPTFPIIITSYETAIRDQNKLMKFCPYTYVIVDEGHRLKNHRCTLLRSLKRLKASNRLLLSGTPIQNTLDELWSLLNFVNPEIFDDLSVFQSWFGFRDIGQKKQGATDEDAILAEQRKNQTISKLHSILRPFLLRRVKKDVLKEMPPKKEVVVYSGISKLQAGYAQMIEKGTLRDTLLAKGIENGHMLSQTNKQMNHRKNINHPFLFGEPIDPSSGLHLGTAHPQLLVRASGKFALLDRMLQRLHKDGHQVLVFSQMTSVLNIIEDYLRFRGWNYFRIDGSTKIDDRQKQMDEFNAEKTKGSDGQRNMSDDRYFCFLLSTRAGGLGINLTSADTCIIFDSDWNPHADSQAMDRCHRIGQTLPVAVYRLITVNSVDIEMMDKQISKKKLERMTITGGDFRKAGRRVDGELSFDQLTSLLQSDIKDLNAKGGDVEDIKISDEEFELIMDRKRLFLTGSDAIPTEGQMYDVIEAETNDMLGSMGEKNE